MIAVAANTFQDFFGQLIPSFKEQVQKTAQEKRSGVTSSEGTNLATPAGATQ